MRNKIRLLRIILLSALCCCTVSSFAQPTQDGLGQTIQIYTRFHSIKGNPRILIIIRDVDHNQNVPYVFDIRHHNNFWLIFTYSKNYLITASELQISTPESNYNSYGNYHIRNFCHLESNGHIMREKSMYITIDGSLSSHPNTYNCSVSEFKDANFSIAKQEMPEEQPPENIPAPPTETPAAQVSAAGPSAAGASTAPPPAAPGASTPPTASAPAAPAAPASAAPTPPPPPPPAQSGGGGGGSNQQSGNTSNQNSPAAQQQANQKP